MSFSVLVLHGPNLSLLAADEIDPRLEARASELGVELLVVQSNGEQGLLDALHAEADKADAILVNPGALAPLAFSLAEGLSMTGLPVIEVLLKSLTPERGISSLTGVAKQHIHGLGVDGYVRALELLVPEGKVSSAAEKEAEEEEEEEVEAPKGKSIGRKPLGKSIGRKAAVVAVAEAPAVKGKTIGRGAATEKKAPAVSVPATMLTRSQVSERIKRRLKGQESAEVLAQWARETWTGLQRGASCEAGSKDLIENVLLTLMAGAKASDAMLVAQMAKLDR
jgi:3-dehydroquinate dehydratase II